MRAVCSSRRSAGWSILLTVGIVQRFGDAVELPGECRKSTLLWVCPVLQSSFVLFLAEASISWSKLLQGTHVEVRG
jgi:hypothetical protein